MRFRLHHNDGFVEVLGPDDLPSILAFVRAQWAVGYYHVDAVLGEAEAVRFAANSDGGTHIFWKPAQRTRKRCATRTPTQSQPPIPSTTYPRR
jgi:hypothetical protein